MSPIILTMLIFAWNCCPNDLHCLMCLGQKCVICANSFPSIDAHPCQNPSKPVTNCFIYSADGLCSRCVSGFYATNSGICLPLDTSIANTCLLPANNSTFCKVCQNRVLSDNGLCNSQQACSDPNCLSCYIDLFGNQQCFKCQKGYFVFMINAKGVNFCTAEASSIYNCSRSTSMNFCTVCDEGFYHQNGECINSPYTIVNFSQITIFLRKLTLLFISTWLL